MNKFLLIITLLLFQGAHCFAQTIEIRSAKDSTTIQCKAIIIQNDQLIGTIYSTKTGQILLSDEYQGAYVELIAADYERKLVPYSSSMPAVLYLQPISQRIEEMVVTGQMQQTTISDAVQSVRIINAKKIEQMGAQNLNQLLKNELNIQLSNDQVLGSSMSLQGIGGENVKFLVDGVPIIGRLNGSVDLDQINLANVERIEIIEGPLSVNYGSDALAGTINIITKNNYTNTVQGSAKAYYESNGTYNTSISGAYQLKNTLISVDLNRNYFDGWRADESNFHREKERIADTLRTKTFKPREQLFGGIKINQVLKRRIIGQDLTLNIQSRLFEEEILNRGTPFKPYYLKAFDETYQTTRFDNSIALQGGIASKWSIQSTNAYNFFERRKNTYINDLTTLNQTLTDAESDQDTSTFDLWMSRTSFIYAHNKKFNYELGYDVNYESSRGQRIENQAQAIGDYAIYATSEMILFSKLIVKPGIRASYNSVYSSPIIPSIFLKYAITKKNQVRFSYSRGFRAPSLKELYFFFVDINHNIQGNEALKAENSNNYQLSLRTSYNKEKCFITLTNQLFFNDLSNVITLAQISATEYSYINLLKSKTFGYTLNSHVSYKQFSLELGGNIRGNQAQVSVEENRYKTGWYPEIKVNPSYTLKKINTTIAAYYKFTGQIPNFKVDSEGAIVQNRRESFQMLDITASTKIWKDRFFITAGVKNLFNIKTISGTSSGSAHSSGTSSIQIGMGRTYFASLTITLKSKKNVQQ